MNRRDGREVANHFKWLASQFPVTFLFVGVGILERQLLSEGLCPADAALAQTARRWTALSLSPFEIATDSGRRTWRRLLLAIERDLVLTGGHQGMLADQLADYLYARSTGHFASLMTLITRGCRHAIQTGAERLTPELLDLVHNDQAARALAKSSRPRSSEVCSRHASPVASRRRRRREPARRRRADPNPV